MQQHIISQINIIGIAVRTTNANGQSAIDIEALWGKFWKEEIHHQIPNKINNDIYAVYTDYETDYTGAYTTIIGASVSSLNKIPEGFVGISIESNQYENYISKGKMPEAILNTWLEIWNDEALNLRRAYHADFTIHGEKYYLGDQAEVSTFISVTSEN
ncbi:GyrI-like domain-containing protein [Pedobacter sp.]